MGVGSNLIVRDGGIRGVVIRLGRGFNGIAVEGDTVRRGRRRWTRMWRARGEAGRDLTFLRTIPGSHRRRGADERGLLRHLRGRPFRLGPAVNRAASGSRSPPKT
jgi:hypothetical protein